MLNAGDTLRNYALRRDAKIVQKFQDACNETASRISKIAELQERYSRESGDLNGLGEPPHWRGHFLIAYREVRESCSKLAQSAKNGHALTREQLDSFRDEILAIASRVLTGDAVDRIPSIDQFRELRRALWQVADYLRWFSAVPRFARAARKTSVRRRSKSIDPGRAVDYATKILLVDSRKHGIDLATLAAAIVDAKLEREPTGSGQRGNRVTRIKRELKRLARHNKELGFPVGT